MLAYAKVLAMSKTATYQLIEHVLGEDLATYVAARRDAGDSWDAISRAIYDRTNITVTRESLRNWFPEPVAAQELSA